MAKQVEKIAVTEKAVSVKIAPLNMLRARLTISGNAPLVQHRFGKKARDGMQGSMEGGQQAKNRGKKKAPKDFEADYLDAMHKDVKGGWYGIPAPAFRAAMIRACSVAGAVMTMAKMSVFVEADGYGEDGTPLVKITKGAPHMVIHPVRFKGTCSLCARPMFDPGWEAVLTVRWDGDQMQLVDICNLLVRAGIQVGVGEGRPFSKESTGMGWGTFDVAREAQAIGAE
jgi:hypothetical protein